MSRPTAGGVHKLAYYVPLAKGECEGCGKPIVYNMAAHLLEHVEPNPGCPNPSVKIEYTPEQEARIAASEAATAAEGRGHRDRHAWMLATIADPILRALVEAHRPDSDGWYPDCAECPRPEGEMGSPIPQPWPCGVWTFISDRMETP